MSYCSRDKDQAEGSASVSSARDFTRKLLHLKSDQCAAIYLLRFSLFSTFRVGGFILLELLAGSGQQYDHNLRLRSHLTSRLAGTTLGFMLHI